MIKLVSEDGDFRWVQAADVVDVELNSVGVTVTYRNGATRTLADPDEETREIVSDWGHHQ